MERTWWREPVLHFAVLGALVFAIERATAQPEAEPPIIVTPSFIDALELENRQRSGRDANVIERAGLIARYVREEALFREARRLGLDRGDMIIRRRLIQKMEFVMRSGVEVPEPSDEELEAYLAEHRAELAGGARVQLAHVYFERGSEDRAREVLATLSPETTRAEDRGDPYLSGYVFPIHAEAWYAARFGDAFAEAVFDAPVGSWVGPVESAHGVHLVRVSHREESTEPDVASMRAELRRRWQLAHRDAAFERALERLVAQHEVQRE